MKWTLDFSWDWIVLSLRPEISQDFGLIPAKGGSGNTDIKLQITGDSANDDWEKSVESSWEERMIVK